MFDKIRDLLSAAFSKTTDNPGYGHDDHAVFPPRGAKLLHTAASGSETDEVIGDVITIPSQFFEDRGPAQTL